MSIINGDINHSILFYGRIQFHFSSCTVFKFSYLKTAFLSFTHLCGTVPRAPSPTTDVSHLVRIVLNIAIPTHSQVFDMPPPPFLASHSQVDSKLARTYGAFGLLYNCSLSTAHCFSMTGLSDCLNLMCFSPSL